MMRLIMVPVLFVAAVPLGAQPFAAKLQPEMLKNDAAVVSGMEVKAGDGCSGGLIYDDGAFENGIRFSAADSRMVQRFDVVGAKQLSAVCICWQSLSSGDSAVNFNIQIYDDNGLGGAPGSLLRSIPASAAGIPNGLGGKFYRYELTGVEIDGNSYVGVQLNGNAEPGIYLCTDEGFAPAHPAYASINGGAFWGEMIDLDDLFEAFGVRGEVNEIADPEPPLGAWLTTPALPLFQFKAQITSGATVIAPSLESDCLPETLCLSGALAGRSELFARVIGPRPNGFLWVNLVRFTTSQVEVWVQKRSGGEIRYYKLPAIPTDSSDLTGLVDKQAFTP